MKTSRIYGICTLQIIGLGVQGMNMAAGSTIIFLCSLGMILYAATKGFRKGSLIVCPQCGTQISKKARICPKCGHQYAEEIREEELTSMIEQERDEERTSEKIDYDFEKIEEIAIDTLTSFDGDIQEFLERKEVGEELPVR